MTNCHNEVQQTQVDVLCTAVETRAVEMASELCAVVLYRRKTQGPILLRAVRTAHMTFADAVLKTIRG